MIPQTRRIESTNIVQTYLKSVCLYLYTQAGLNAALDSQNMSVTFSKEFTKHNLKVANNFISILDSKFAVSH
jgi:hypothetical protein